jgi:hypothetical protein
MFVHRMRGVVTTTLLGVLSLGVGACDDPAQNTDLRPEGPPEVLAVLVMTDAAGQLVEQATFCKQNDEKRPSQVGLPDFTIQQVCPANTSEPATQVNTAYPDGWYVRIMFDELLDADIETLTEVEDPDTGEPSGTFVGSIAATHPVKLECESVNGGMVEVDYDGYYSPSGNKITWPLGPSLVIKPNDPTLIATSSACQVTINANVVDKTGTAVDAAQRGPYKFGVAPIQVVVIDPADESEIDASQVWVDNIYVQFNTTVDESSFCDEGATMDQCEFTFTPDIGECSASGAPCEVQKNGSDCPMAAETCDSGGFYAYSLAPYGFTDAEFGFGPNLPVQVEKDYTFSFLAGGKIKDRCGKETTFGAPSVDDQTLIHYTTNPFKFNTATIATGETASAMKKLQLNFSNVIDTTSLEPTEYTLTPAPLTPTVSTGNGNDLKFNGFFKINTEYTFTLNAGATILDAWGVVYTNPEVKTIKWKTQPAITVAVTPADNSTVSRSAATTTVGATLAFNTAIKPTEITEGTDFTVTDSNGTVVTGFTVASTTCLASSTSCSVTIKKAVPDGTYTFTLKAGAMMSDQNGDVYTQAADKIVHFTVETNPPVAVECL